jgi:protocatechuate 3,4-dioxygenase beta subunit
MSIAMAILIGRREAGTQCEGVVEGYAHTAQRWPTRLQRRPLGASELSGPQAVLKRLPPVRGDLAGHGAKRALGQLMHLNVRIVDEDGAPVPGAVVEIWHCNAAGKYIHANDTHDAPADPNFYGAARVVTGEDGAIVLRSIKPGAYPVPDSGRWWRPPHVHLSVWGRVWLSRLVTQMFFPGEPLNEFDRILNGIPDAAARGRCVARLRPTTEGPDNALVFEHEIVVRGRAAAPQLP